MADARVTRLEQEPRKRGTARDAVRVLDLLVDPPFTPTDRLTRVLHGGAEDDHPMNRRPRVHMAHVASTATETHVEISIGENVRDPEGALSAFEGRLGIYVTALHSGDPQQLQAVLTQFRGNELQV